MLVLYCRYLSNILSKMTSGGTAAVAPNRCVNCAIRFHRSIRKHLLADIPTNLRQLIRSWISREFFPQDAICGNCFSILQECMQTPHPIRRFGYRNVCIPCGSSILRAPKRHAVAVDCAERNVILAWIPLHQVQRLKQVCMACWLKAVRRVHKQQQDLRRVVEMTPLDANNVPPPPPRLPAPPVQPKREAVVPTITITTYKRATATFTLYFQKL